MYKRNIVNGDADFCRSHLELVGLTAQVRAPCGV